MTDFEQLIVATISGNFAKVADLLDNHPHLVNKKDEDGATALHWASSKAIQQLFEETR